MNYGPLIFLGLLLSVATSWFATVLGPHLQFGDLPMVNIEETGQDYPLARAGEARQGQEVYRANGCVYCHTQVVRGGGGSADIARKWGNRRTVARDYVRDEPPMLGSVRVGPDLTNIGVRETNTNTLLVKLYNPRASLPGSPMPRYSFLFEQRAIRPGDAPDPNALVLPAAFAAPAGYQIVPKPEALQLVKYLASLKSDTLFFEVFPNLPPKPATNQAVTANAPAGASNTNSVLPKASQPTNR